MSENKKSISIKIFPELDFICTNTDTTDNTSSNVVNQNTTKNELYISEPSDSDNEKLKCQSIDDEEHKKKRLKIEKPKCPGCYPVYQPNQLGHIGPYGCLGDEF